MAPRGRLEVCAEKILIRDTSGRKYGATKVVRTHLRDSHDPSARPRRLSRSSVAFIEMEHKAFDMPAKPRDAAREGRPARHSVFNLMILAEP